MPPPPPPMQSHLAMVQRVNDGTEESEWGDAETPEFRLNLKWVD